MWQYKLGKIHNMSQKLGTWFYMQLLLSLVLNIISVIIIVSSIINDINIITVIMMIIMLAASNNQIHDMG